MRKRETNLGIGRAQCKTWFVIASRTGAKIFEKASGTRPLTLVHELEHPEGRLRDREIVSDRPGRTLDSITFGGHRAEPRKAAHQEVAEDFARHIADALERYHLDQHFDEVVLVAEAKFLGVLRSALAQRSQVHIRADIEKNWMTLPAREIATRVKELSVSDIL